MLVAPFTTWLLVSTSPSDVRIMPVPALCEFWYRSVDTMVTTPTFCLALARVTLVDVPPPLLPGSEVPPEPSEPPGVCGVVTDPSEPEPATVLESSLTASPMAMPPTRAAAVRAAIPAPSRQPDLRCGGGGGA